MDVFLVDGFIVLGTGSVVGQAFSEHPNIRKLGFTGSTPIGKTIMERYILCVCVCVLWCVCACTCVCVCSHISVLVVCV